MIRYNQLMNAQSKASRKTGGNVHRLAFKPKEFTGNLKGSTPAPMSCLRRPRTSQPGKVKGILTIEFDEIDSIMQQMSTLTTSCKAVHDFESKYSQYYHKTQPFEIAEVCYDHFRETCLRGWDSAPGSDGWSNKDVALLSDSAIKLVVNCFDAIEQGAPWADTVGQARAVSLAGIPVTLPPL